MRTPVSQSVNRSRVTVLGSNLSGGGALACATIARALRDRYDVQIVGPAFGARLWHGLDPEELDLVTLPGGQFPGFFQTLRRLRASIQGDVVVAYGLRLPSFGLALAHRARTGTPLVLYVDEDDIALTMPGRRQLLRRRLVNPNGDLPTRLMVRLRNRADAIFCGSGVLAARFNGTVAPLGRDPATYDPARFDRQKTRDELGFGEDDVVIGFIGNPREHVGIEDLLRAVEIAGPDRYVLMVAPPGAANEFAVDLFQRTTARVELVENEPSCRVPEFIHASDIVVVPQRAEDMSLGQTPARLIEAMAMGKPIIATRLADMPNLLDGGAGLLVSDRNPQEIAKNLEWLRAHPVEAEAMGRRARERFLVQLSLEAMAGKLAPEIDRLLKSRTRR